MKTKYVVLGMLVGVLAFILVTGCDNGTGGGGSDGIDAKWQGRYVGGDDYVIVNGTTASYFIDGARGTISNITTEAGGDVLYSGTVVGSWVYVLSDGNKSGFVMNETVNRGTYIGVGAYGANSLINEITRNGGSFSPSPSTSGLPTAYYFWGQKQ
jgi:hypothetical protein